MYNDNPDIIDYDEEDYLDGPADDDGWDEEDEADEDEDDGYEY